MRRRRHAGAVRFRKLDSEKLNVLRSLLRQVLTQDLAAGPPYTFESTETLLLEFDANVERVREALRTATDDDFALTWKLRYAEEVVDTGGRKAVLRNTINHFVHHRGQLTVYLRMNDVPLPGLYGPSADEK